MNTRTVPEVADGLAVFGESAPVALERIVALAEQSAASDIHIQRTADEATVAFRLDGVMKPVAAMPAELAERVSGRIKFLSNLRTYQDSMPQEGRIAKEALGSRADARVSTYPAVTGEKIVLRLFSAAQPRTVEDLQFPDAARAAIASFLRGPAGMLLLTGPAGSGKTTTIYACLQFLARSTGRHIITIEDPVEQVVPGVMQTEVNPPQGLTFAAAARHLLRQDPEVLVIGEIRDEETANAAIRAALTGHMVISTLHAGSCRGVLERLLVLCEDRHSALSSLELVLNQRLLRRRCAGCGGAGCATCLNTGYHGRVPVVEWLRLDEAGRAAIRDGGPGAAAPALPLREAARVLVARGATDEAECGRIFGP